MKSVDIIGVDTVDISILYQFQLIKFKVRHLTGSNRMAVTWIYAIVKNTKLRHFRIEKPHFIQNITWCATLKLVLPSASVCVIAAQLESISKSNSVTLVAIRMCDKCFQFGDFCNFLYTWISFSLYSCICISVIHCILKIEWIVLMECIALHDARLAWPGPPFCLLLGVSSDYAQPITGQIVEVTCPVIDRAQPEFTPNKRQKNGSR